VRVVREGVAAADAEVVPACDRTYDQLKTGIQEPGEVGWMRRPGTLASGLGDPCDILVDAEEMSKSVRELQRARVSLLDGRDVIGVVRVQYGVGR
jgi:hypothetical protein